MNELQVPVITIDGPSGSGKGTISALIARGLGWHMLDSGALYRLVALAAKTHAISLEDTGSLATLARHLDVEFRARGNNETGIFLEGEEVSAEIRTEEAGNAASRVAAIPEVRQALLERQRAFLEAPGLIADGRDMGTVVFPSAPLKIYLTASPEERAKRRYKQLKEKGMSVNLSALSREIAERDERDASRPVAPLRPAEDAVIVDTSELSIEEVVQKITTLIRNVVHI